MIVQLREQHERYAEAREAQLAELHARIAQQSTPSGALAFAARRWLSALRRQIHLRSRRPDGGQ
jgi:hypothetical protein